MLRFLMLVAVCVTVVTAGDVATRCVGGGELPSSFEIEGCSSAPCVLPQLEDAILKAKFSARNGSNSLRANVVAYLLGIINVPFDLGARADACSSLDNAACPVEEGQELEYTLTLPIEPLFPVGLSTNVEISVRDDSGAPAFCARVPILVGAPRN